MAVEHQVHTKFKVFIGDTIGEVAANVEAYASDGSVAAKSIGIEFIESSNQFLLSLGSADDQAGYPVAVTEKVIGTVPSTQSAGELATALEKAAAEAGDVICHELYVDADAKVHIVFMQKA